MSPLVIILVVIVGIGAAAWRFFNRPAASARKPDQPVVGSSSAPAEAKPAPKPETRESPTRHADGLFPSPPPPAGRMGTGAPQATPGSATTGTFEPPANDVRFTAFYPKEAAAETWYTLLVYAHIDTMINTIRADAAKFSEEMGNVPREARSTATAKLARGTDITISPQCEGVTFNPSQITLKWVEDIHRADFRFRANVDQAGSAANLLITIFVGPLIVATIKGGILFNEPNAEQKLTTNIESTASIYRAEQIFPSYSRADEQVVIACRNAYKALGFQFLRDKDTLRPGEKWHPALMHMIDNADIFQLFWSENSSKSVYVQQEWEYALKQRVTKGDDFIRPVYWKNPLVPPPSELAEINFTYVPLAGSGE
jgi:hypothetical protein